MGKNRGWLALAAIALLLLSPVAQMLSGHPAVLFAIGAAIVVIFFIPAQLRNEKEQIARMRKESLPAENAQGIENVGERTESIPQDNWDIMDLVRGLAVTYPLLVIRLIRHIQASFRTIPENRRKRILICTFLLELLVIAFALFAQKNPFLIISDAILCTPVGGAFDLGIKVVSYLIKSMSSPDQLYADAAAVEYAMNHFPSFLEQHSGWLISWLQYFMLESLMEGWNSIQNNKILLNIRGVVFNMAFGIISTAVMDRFIWGDSGVAHFLLLPNTHKALSFVALSLSFALVLTMILLSFHIFFVSFYELMVVLGVSLIRCSVLLLAGTVITMVVNSGATIALLRYVLTDSAGFYQEYHAFIDCGFALVFMISYISLHINNAALMEYSPEASANTWGDILSHS